MSQRKTQNSQRAATVGEALAALTQRLTPIPGPSNAPRVSSIPSDYVVEPVEDDTEENPQGTGAQSDHDGDQEQDRDSDNDQAPNRGASAPPPESALARSLELLASKIAAIPDNPKPSSSVKTRIPDVFDGSDPNKLETFTFQLGITTGFGNPRVSARVCLGLGYGLESFTPAKTRTPATGWRV